MVQAGYRLSLPTGVSFVDRISFAVIEREAPEAVFATDADFRAVGVPLVPGLAQRGP